MKTSRRTFLILLSLLLLLLPILTSCSLVKVAEETTRAGWARTTAEPTDEPTAAPTDPASADPTSADPTAAPTAAPTTPGTTAEPTALQTTGEPFIPTPDEPESDAAYQELYDTGKTLHNGREIVSPSRVGVAYANPLPSPASLDYAASRAELIEIANWHAFYREGTFSVTLGYGASDAEEELTYLYRFSCFLPSLCSVSGSLSGGVLEIKLKFYPESYLAFPQSIVCAQVLGGENTPPNGTDTLPGLDPVSGISVWDSEQASYCLSHGYAIAPIPGSPAEVVVERAREILSGIVDDGMTEWQIVYRVYRWIMEHSTYDYDGDTWAGQSIDPENEPEMLPARLASFLAEGPLFYEAGVCFGYAKAGAILLGLEGLEVRRVVAFSYELPQSRTWTKIDPNTGKHRTSIEVHSYDYVRIDGHDYIFDPSFAKNGTLQVNTTAGASVKIPVMKDFAIGLTKNAHVSFYPEFPADPFSVSSEYSPASYSYLQNLTYDGSHVLLITSKEEAQTYYAYLKNNVFNGTPEFRTLTLFFSGKNSTLSAGNWRTIYESDLVAFLDSLGIPCKYDYSTAAARTGADVMVMVAFGK